MLNQLFFHSNTLTRQLSAPFVDERCQYLSQCAAQGMAKRTLRMKARLLLSITEYLRLAERPDDRINLEEIEKVATRWSSHNWPSSKSLYAKLSREYFVTQATRWLRFLNRLQTVPKQLTPYDGMLGRIQTLHERSLSPTTVESTSNQAGVRPRKPHCADQLLL